MVLGNEFNFMNKIDAIDIACKYLISIGMINQISERMIRVEQGSTFSVIFSPKKKSRSGNFRIVIDMDGIILSTKYER